MSQVYPHRISIFNGVKEYLSTLSTASYPKTVDNVNKLLNKGLPFFVPRR